MTIVIGFAGYSRAGKSTAMAAAHAAHPGFTNIRSFADPVRDLAYEISADYRNMVDAHGYEQAKDHYPVVRETLVAVGAGIRKLDPDFWVNRMRRLLIEHSAPTLIPDVRYLNEVEMIQSLGGLVIWVEREGCVPANEEESLNGPSVKLESNLLIVNNNLTNFRRTVELVVEAYMLGRAS